MTNRDGFRGINDPAGAKSPYVNQKGPQHNGGATDAAHDPAPRLFVQDADFTLYVGDALEVLLELPDESVHCCVTSPPYWGLRDYGTGAWDGGDPDCDHRKKDPDVAARKSTLGPNGDGLGPGNQAHNVGAQFGSQCGKCGATRVDQQIGLEATPELFVESMVAVFREVRRVLRGDGTLWLNLGDSYIGGGRGGVNGDGGGSISGERASVGQRWGPPTRGVTGLKAKDLVGIPWRVAFALQADGWA